MAWLWRGCKSDEIPEGHGRKVVAELQAANSHDETVASAVFMGWRLLTEEDSRSSPQFQFHR